MKIKSASVALIFALVLAFAAGPVARAGCASPYTVRSGDTLTRIARNCATTVAALKAAGVWEKYSQVDYAALKKAMADPKHHDRAVFESIKPLLRKETEIKVSLE